MGRLLAIGGGVVWLLAIASIAIAVHWSERPRKVPPLTAVPTLLRELSATRASHAATLAALHPNKISLAESAGSAE